VDLEFTDDALEAVADLAILRGTGARGLRAILEEVLMSVMYEVPSRKDVERVVMHPAGGAGARETPPWCRGTSPAAPRGKSQPKQEPAPRRSARAALHADAARAALSTALDSAVVSADLNQQRTELPPQYVRVRLRTACTSRGTPAG